MFSPSATRLRVFSWVITFLLPAAAWSVARYSLPSCVGRNGGRAMTRKSPDDVRTAMWRAYLRSHTGSREPLNGI